MSTPTHKMRQPGRLLAPYDPGNCQVCDPNKGIPNNTLGLVLEGMPFGCCSIDISSTQANPHILTAITDPCLKDLFGNKLACTWTLTLTLGGLYVEFTVTLSCVGGTTPTIAIGVNQVDSSGAFIAAVASGSATLSGACGAVDCSQLNGISGTLTLYDGSICQPSAGHCTSPTWDVLFGTQNCPANHANECCCGGPPVQPCQYVCIHDPACAGGGSYDVRVCRQSDGSFSGTDPLSGISATWTYEAGVGWTISYTCNGGGGHSHTFPPADPGVSNSAGFLTLTYHDPSGWTIDASTGGPVCAAVGALPPCNECAGGSMAKEYLVEIGAGWNPNPAGDTTCTFRFDDARGFRCDDAPCAGSTGGVPGAYYMTASASFEGYCAMQGPSPDNTGCCDGPKGPDCGTSYLYFGQDGGGYFIAFIMLGGIIGGSGCDMSSACVWGRWKLYVEGPIDCININGLSLPYVGLLPGDGTCSCVTGGASCTVTAL